MYTDQVVQGWHRLLQGKHEAAGLEIPSIETGVGTGFGNIRLALGTSGEPRLLLPIRQNETVPEIASTDAIRIATATYTLGGSPTRYLDVTCTAEALHPVFAEVGDEIIRRVAAGHTSIAACRSTIEDFRSLLVRESGALTSEKVRGLIGELLVMVDLLEIEADAAKLWRGPLGERHDFRGASIALEVKTRARAAGAITISSLDQLQEPQGGELGLAVLHLQTAPGGRHTVGSLANRAFALSSDPEMIGKLLASLGCTNPNAETWNAEACELDGVEYFQVVGDFPRVVPGSFAAGVPAGVETLSYTIDLAAAGAHRIAEPKAWLERMCTCLTH